jgi:hypothetical protein
MLATPIMIANVVVLLAAGFWGWVADRFSRRASMIIPGVLSIPLAFFYLLFLSRHHLLAWWMLPIFILFTADAVNTSYRAGWRAVAAAICFPLEIFYAWLITAAIFTGYFRELFHVGSASHFKRVRGGAECRFRVSVRWDDRGARGARHELDAAGPRLEDLADSPADQHRNGTAPVHAASFEA